VAGLLSTIREGELPRGLWTYLESPEDTVQNPAVINTGHTARLVRKQGLDDRPFAIRQLVPPPRQQRPPCL